MEAMELPKERDRIERRKRTRGGSEDGRDYNFLVVGSTRVNAKVYIGLKNVTIHRSTQRSQSL